MTAYAVIIIIAFWPGQTTATGDPGILDLHFDPLFKLVPPHNLKPRKTWASVTRKALSKC